MQALTNDRPFGNLDDIAMVRDAARGLLARSWPAARAVALSNSADDLRRMFGEAAAQGWTLLDPVADHNALSFALTILQELGRASCPIAVHDAVLMNIAFSPEQGAAVLQAMQAGKAVPAWALASADQDDAVVAQATAEGGVRLNGKVSFVEHAQSATHLIVELGGAGGRFAIVACGAPGLAMTMTLGLSVPALAEFRFDGVVPERIVESRVSASRLAAIARLLLAARAHGAATRALELLTDYAKVRVQFGKLIGQYQAIQHKLANCLIAIETSRLALLRAGAGGVAPGDDGYAGAVAVAGAARSLRNTALELHHGFGGVSFWEDHEMPRHFRRIHGDLVRYGGVQSARGEIADRLLGSPKQTATARLGRLPDISLGEQADRFRLEVRGWLAENWSREPVADDPAIPVNHRLADRAFSRKLGEKGWLSLTWPKRWGGQQRSAMEQLAFEEEMSYAEAPIGWHFTSAGMMAPTLMEFGSAEQCERFIPAIARGDICFALGYSEPDHGSDLAGIKTAAIATDDGWMIRGQKIYTSTAGYANYCWLAARSNPDNPRHGGISVFIVPLDSPGITIQPMIGLNGHRANIVFYDDVRLPADALVGELHGGWKVITAALAHERIALAGIAARARSYFDQLVSCVLTVRRNGQPMAADPLVRDTIAGLAAEIEAARLLAAETARLSAGVVPAHQAAMVKVYSSELMERLAETALDLLGSAGSLKPGPSSSLVNGRFEYAVRDALLYTIGGGTNEIQRTLIALRGLGLPR